MQIFAYLSLSLGSWDYSFYQIPKRVADPENVKKYILNLLHFLSRRGIKLQGMKVVAKVTQVMQELRLQISPVFHMLTQGNR